MRNPSLDRRLLKGGIAWISLSVSAMTLLALGPGCAVNHPNGYHPTAYGSAKNVLRHAGGAASSSSSLSPGDRSKLPFTPLESVDPDSPGHSLGHRPIFQKPEIAYFDYTETPLMLHWQTSPGVTAYDFEIQNCTTDEHACLPYLEIHCPSEENRCQVTDTHSIGEERMDYRLSYHRDSDGSAVFRFVDERFDTVECSNEESLKTNGDCPHSVGPNPELRIRMIPQPSVQ